MKHDHNWSFEQLLSMKESISKEIDAIKEAQLKELYLQLNTVEMLLNAYEDGYTYWVCIKSYGSSSWTQYPNLLVVSEIVDRYGDGYDGLVDVYSDNPELLKRVGETTYRCDTYFSLEDLPKEKDDHYEGSPFAAGMMMGLKSVLKD
jgi:hypothetical protein